MKRPLCHRDTHGMRSLDDRSPETLAAVLLYGSEASRRALAARLLEDRDHSVLTLLAETAASDDSWLLRSRCLEVLGAVVAHAPQPTAQQVLQALWPRRP